MTFLYNTFYYWKYVGQDIFYDFRDVEQKIFVTLYQPI